MLLRRRIERLEGDTRDVSKLVLKLRSEYPEYARKKLAPFHAIVAGMLERKQKQDAGKPADDSSSEGKGKSPRKKQKTRVSESGEGDSGNLLNLSLRAAYQTRSGEGVAGSSNLSSGTTTAAGSLVVTPENVRFDNFGALDAALEPIYRCIYRLRNPHCFPRQKTVTGILLYGPPGCGKTLLAHAIANEAGLPILKAAAAELTPSTVRSWFGEAERLARCLLLLDEIDAVAVSRDARKDPDCKTLTQLMSCMDSLSHLWDSGRDCPGHVVIVGTTNRPEVIDPALRRCGRFSIEVSLGAPDEKARAEILTVLARDMLVEGARDFTQVARKTRGFVAADLFELTQHASFLAEQRRVSSDLAPEAVWWKHVNTTKGEPTVSMQDFEMAASQLQPSLARKGFSPSPNVSWDDVGGYSQVTEEMKRCISRCMFPSDECKRLAVRTSAGILLYGPPGCGKTLIAKAAASFANASFISVKGPELVRKYLGDSEEQIRSVFKRAQECPPCVICFDEIDSLCLSRGREGNSAMDRVVNQFLVEMDALPAGVIVIATTNKIEAIDEAFLRPGRLGNHIEIPLPDEDTRVSILKAASRHKPLAADVDVVAVAKCGQLRGLSGSHLSELVEHACVAAVDEGVCELHQRHFEAGLAKLVEREAAYVSRRQHQRLSRDNQRGLVSAALF